MNNTGSNNIFSVSFDSMENDAKKKISDVSDVLRQERSVISPLAEGRTSLSVTADMVGFIVVTLVFAAVIVVIWIYGNNPNIVNLIGTIFFGIFFLIMLIKRVLVNSHSTKVIQKVSQIDYLDNYVNDIRTEIPKTSKEYFAGLRNNREEKIVPGKCIDEQLRGIKSVSNRTSRLGILTWLENALFLAAGVVMTIMGSLALWELIDLIFDNFDLPILVVHIVCIVSMVVVSVAMVIASKYVWGLTDCKVKNLTLLPILLGPVAFLLVFAAIAIVLLLVAVALYIIFGLIGVAIVIFCISASGGG